ncbi:type II secretion system F family protein [Agromyces albus]|uniref:Type II secretion system F family protein n=1 Tax=Agromyces albus TaxID=205332 RepID=A0A4Q2L3E4_9MICO|nr:type II secretion system F family protein [Agromyces albus]RXZ72675.1 type II secretion system F family protein [Agromyces albus]
MSPLLLAYAGIALTALGLGVFVFVLFPGNRVAEEPVAEIHPTLGPVQRSSLGATLVEAAPHGYTGWLEKQIAFAGRPIGWSPSKIVTWKLVLTAVGGLFGLMFVLVGGPHPLKILLALAGTLLLFFLPDGLINSRAHDRQEAMKRALPDTLDQMTIAVEAGLGFDGAMAKAARNGRGPLAEELIRVLQDMSIGRTRRESFGELERRTNSEDLRRFIRAVIQADAYGVAIGDVLRVQAGEMRLKRRQRAEEQAMKVSVKIIFPLVFCLMPVLFIVLLTPAVIGALDSFSGFGPLGGR